jgi:hypothetical protein
LRASPHPACHPVVGGASEPVAKVLRVAAGDARLFAGRGKLAQRVGPRRFEQPVAVPGRIRVRDDERPRDEVRQEVDHGEFVDRLVGSDERSGLEREASGENRETVEHGSLALGEQFVAPVERGAQRLLARKRRSAPSREQLEAVLQAEVDLVDRQRMRTPGGQFERQRDAVQASADRRDRRRLPLGDDKARLEQADALDQHLHRFGRRQRLEIGIRRGQRQRRHDVDLLAGNLQRLATARQDTDFRRRLQERRRERGAGGDHVLAVVEHQQQAPGLEMIGERLRELRAGSLLNAQHLGDRARDEKRIRDRRELDEPHAIGIGVVGVGRRLQREPGLADAADADQREQPASCQEPLDLGGFLVATDERRDLLREVVGRPFERAQRGKVGPELRMHELIDPLGHRQILEPHGAEVAQRARGRQLPEHAIGHRLRHEDLTAVSGPHDPRRPVDGAAEVVVVAPLDFAEMQPAADAQRQSGRRLRIGEPALNGHGGVESGDRLVEGSVHSVAGHLDDRPAVGHDGRPHQRIVARQRGPHLLGLLLPEVRAAFDVGEKESYRAGHGRLVFTLIRTAGEWPNGRAIAWSTSRWRGAATRAPTGSGRRTPAPRRCATRRDRRAMPPRASRAANPRARREARSRA